ncbi:GIY-YIG nuclease family protein [Sphingobium sp. WCS2017Hpa-17]|uniref:GIY-YIG nuclease family protein n=1 Tax=Sphingobium sp. WCS2017Hpa-17 TaxID=3073638 RepID=UPI00288B7E2C|nr:GIY-YIG nuclease family protein [Sphingobium sp. WCS2017Hpa-17]
MNSFVYYIACTETRRVKIGFTSGNVMHRLRALQTGSAAPLVLIACHPGSMADEKRIHEQFDAQRVQGEWFDMSEDLFMHVSMVTWLAASECAATGAPVADWLRVGLQSMNEESPLPAHLAALI